MKNFLLNLSYTGAFIISVVLGGVYHFTLFDNGQSLQYEIESMKSEIEEKTKVTQDLSQQNRLLTSLLESKKNLGQHFERFISYIPETDTASSYVKLLNSQAKLANVKILSLTRKGEEKKSQGLYSELIFSIQLEGSYSDIVLFLSYLSKVERIINLGDFTLVSKKEKTNSGSSVVSLSTTLTTYKYNKITKDKTQGKNNTKKGGA